MSLLHPRSVALIGASSNSAKVGHIVLRNLRQGAEEGRFKLFPVNPREERILGFRCYPSVLDVPHEVDLAVVALPAPASLGPVKECVRKGVGAVIVSASGFKESGPEGAALEASLAEAVRGSRTRLLGPNTMGVYSPRSGLDTLFIPRERSPRPGKGPIAIVSQSGAVSVSLLEKAAISGVGVSVCVGLGNKADIDENDVVEYLASDRSTRCIALYLESFSHGRAFAELMRRVTVEKPVVMLKAGRTAAGSSAARSHTGAVSSSEAVVRGVLKQVGVIQAYDEEELMDLARALAHLDHLDGDRICVMASAGGFGVIAADLVESRERGAGLRMAELSNRTLSALRKVVPSFGSVQNPVDLTASVTDEMYEAALKLVQADPGVDGIMMSLELQPPHVTSGLVRVAERRCKARGARIVVSAFGGERTPELLTEFERKGVPAYPTIWRAVRALRALSERGRYLMRKKTHSEDRR